MDSSKATSEQQKKKTRFNISGSGTGLGIGGLLVLGGVIAVGALTAAFMHKRSERAKPNAQKSVKDSPTPACQSGNSQKSSCSVHEETLQDDLDQEEKPDLDDEKETPFYDEICKDQTIDNFEGLLPLEIDSNLIKAENIINEYSVVDDQAVDLIKEDEESEPIQVEVMAEDNVSLVQLEEEEEEEEEESGEEGSEGTGDSSMDSNTEAVWPAELIEGKTLEMKMGPKVHFQNEKIEKEDRHTFKEHDHEITGNTEKIEKTGFMMVHLPSLSSSSRSMFWVWSMFMVGLLLLLLLITNHHNIDISYYVPDYDSLFTSN